VKKRIKNRGKTKNQQTILKFQSLQEKRAEIFSKIEIPHRDFFREERPRCYETEQKLKEALARIEKLEEILLTL
jgi:hypothetical protein